MKRLALLAAALMLCGGVALPAHAGPRAPSAGPAGGYATTVRPAGHAVTMHWLRNELIGFHVGPSRATGYGKARLTGFTRGCPECRWFRPTNRMTNHQPIDPTAASGSTPTAERRRGGFCWPWHMFPWSGSGCWNNMATWDWARVLTNFDYQPVWDPMSTLDRIVGCYHGAYQGYTGGVIGRQVVGIMVEMADLVKVTPAGIAWSIIGGCVFHMYHR